MAGYLVKRLFFTLITIILLSIGIFAIVQIPPGDAVDVIIRAREADGDVVTDDEEAQLRSVYGLDRPVIARYWDWVTDLLHGDMGLSVSGQPVKKLVSERLSETIGLSLFSLLVTYLIAIPIGIYSATHQYSIGDYIATTFGFIGLATPNFLLALILLLYVCTFRSRGESWE